MKRFVTLVTVTLVGTAVLTQWQRVKELGHQVLSRRAEKVSVSANENKATARRISDEVFNQGNLSVLDELIAPDYVLHDAGVPGGELRGLEPFKEQWVSMFRTAFPDLRIVIEDQVAEGDKVASRYTCSGTHQGELRGFPPTNNRVEVTGTITSRFAEAKIVEEWNNFDSMGMMQQLAIVPPLEPPKELSVYRPIVWMYGRGFRAPAFIVFSDLRVWRPCTRGRKPLAAARASYSPNVGESQFSEVRIGKRR